MDDKTNLPTQKQNRSVQLHDSGLRAGSLLDASLSRLSESQTQNLLAKAGEEALRLQVKKHEQDMDYVAGKKAAEDHIDTFNMLDRRGKTTRQVISSDFKTGAGSMHIESKSGATCFVASVAYGDPNHSDVLFLRQFRDNVLSQSRHGQAFIAWYWRTGPKIANIVGGSVFFSKFAKLMISQLVKNLRKRFVDQI